jgi:hypothetical protein
MMYTADGRLVSRKASSLRKPLSQKDLMEYPGIRGRTEAGDPNACPHYTDLPDGALTHERM